MKLFHKPRKIALAHLSDQGIRKINQDYSFSVSNYQNIALLGVCDGLGSYFGSEVAAQIVSEQLIAGFLSANLQWNHLSQCQAWFVEQLELARIKISQYTLTHPEAANMTTTLCCGIVGLKEVYLFNIGDSRVYGMRKHQMIQISSDDNFLNQLIKQNKSQAQIAAYGADLYKITNCLGAWEERPITYTSYCFPIEQFDYLVFSTDGLHQFVKLAKMVAILSLDHLIEQHASLLVAEANKNDSNDNISVALCQISH